MSHPFGITGSKLTAKIMFYRPHFRPPPSRMPLSGGRICLAGGKLDMACVPTYLGMQWNNCPLLPQHVGNVKIKPSSATLTSHRKPCPCREQHFWMPGVSSASEVTRPNISQHSPREKQDDTIWSCTEKNHNRMTIGYPFLWKANKGNDASLAFSI